jgi:hypothetical protein
MDPSPAAQRRLKAINAHLISTADDSPSDLRSNPTAGEFFIGTPFPSLSSLSHSIHLSSYFAFVELTCEIR